MYRDQVIELKEKVAELEKEKVDWMDSRVSYSHYNKECRTKDISRTMFELSLK